MFKPEKYLGSLFKTKQHFTCYQRGDSVSPWRYNKNWLYVAKSIEPDKIILCVGFEQYKFARIQYSMKRFTGFDSHTSLTNCVKLLVTDKIYYISHNNLLTQINTKRLIKLT